MPAELIKFWKAVQDDPKDFTGWTYLLQGITYKIAKFLGVTLELL